MLLYAMFLFLRYHNASQDVKTRAAEGTNDTVIGVTSKK